MSTRFQRMQSSLNAGTMSSEHIMTMLSNVFELCETHKFEVGAKVMIIKRNSGHRFNIGDIAVLTERPTDDLWIAHDKDGEWWYIAESEAIVLETSSKCTITKVLDQLRSLERFDIDTNFNGEYVEISKRTEDCGRYVLSSDIEHIIDNF